MTVWAVISITDTDVEVVSYRLHDLEKGRSITQERNILIYVRMENSFLV